MDPNNTAALTAAAEREEKLRLARKKLGKFQKNKKKDVVESNGNSGTVTPVEQPVQPPKPLSFVPVPAPISTASLDDRSPSFDGNHHQSPRSYKNAPTTRPISPSVYAQTQQTDQTNRRSIFNSFVSAMTNTAASIISAETDPQLDDARKALQNAKEERRSRTASRTASPTGRRSSRSPQPASGAVSNVLGMASRLFSNAGGNSAATARSPSLDRQQTSSHYSNHNDYQYGVQEGRDFGQNAEYQSQHPPTSDYQYGGHQYGHQYDQNGSYQYSTHDNQFVDPASYQQHQVHHQDAYSGQQSQYVNTYEHHQDPQQYYEGYNGASNYYTQDQQQQQHYYDQTYQQQPAYNQQPEHEEYSGNLYDQGNFGIQHQPSTGTAGEYESFQPGPVGTQNSFGNLPWELENSANPENAIPGFGVPHSNSSPFNAMESLSSKHASQEFPIQDNLFAEQSVPLSNPLAQQNDNVFLQASSDPFSNLPKPVTPARGRSPSVRSRRSLSRAAAPSPTSPYHGFQQPPSVNGGGSPIPFENYRGGPEFPVSINADGGGLQTWPTSPTQIHNASVSRRTSANPLQQTHSRHVSNNNINYSGAAVSPIVELHRSTTPSSPNPPKRQPSRPASTTVPPIDTSLYHHQQEEQEYHHEQQQYYDNETAITEPPATTSETIQVASSTYTTLIQENDALTRQAAATEQLLNDTIASRLRLEQNCHTLEAEREVVVQELMHLKEVVRQFGVLSERTRQVEELEAILADREERLEVREQGIQNWEEGVLRKESEVSAREVELATAGNEELDSRMRIRIQEIEKSRSEVDELQKRLKAREEQVEKELKEAMELKRESGEALQRVEASLLKVKEREEEVRLLAAKLGEDRDVVNQIQTSLESRSTALDKKEADLKAQEDDLASRRYGFEYELAGFDNEKALLVNGLRNNELEQTRLAEQRHALEVLSERLREDQESVRHREAEIRSREDEFLSEATNMANREAIQLSELRRNYDADMERLQLDTADLEHRERQLTANSDDLYRLSQEVNDEKTRVEQMKRELEHEREELSRQATEIQSAQENLASQQAALDDAVASFSEMKEYIDNSMKENEARIRAEFESLQQAHADLKQREETAMQDIQNERMMIEELQRSIENERQESLRYGADAVANAELENKIHLLEKDNSDLRDFVNELSTARSLAVSQIDELEESNRQLQSNVLRLTQMMESGGVKKSNSLRSMVPAVDENKPPVDERVEILERRYQEISKEESSLKEAAAALVSTANDLKKIWNDAAPALEELKLRREGTPTGNVADRSHMWTNRREAPDIASSTRSLSDADMFGNNKELFNVIVSLTSTNQNLSKKLDETLTQVQTLQQQKSSKRSTKRSDEFLHQSSRRASVGPSEVAETVSSTGVTGFNSAHASSLRDYDDVSVSAATSISQQDGNNGYFASNETMSSYSSGNRTNRFNQTQTAPLYPSARPMTKVSSTVTTGVSGATTSILRRTPYESRAADTADHYADTNSEYSEAMSEGIKPTTSRIPFTSAAGTSVMTPTSLPMARISTKKASHDYNDADSDNSSDNSVQTPRVGGGVVGGSGAGVSKKRSTAPANYYSSTARNFATGSSSSARYGGSKAQTDSASSQYHHYTEPELESTSRSNGQNISRHVSLEGLRSYFTDKDLEGLGEPAQKVMFGSSGSGGSRKQQQQVDDGDGKYGRRDVKFSASSSTKAKSDTEGVSGWGQSKGSSVLGLRAASSIGNRSERTDAIRDAIRARIKERDLGQK